MSGIEVAGLLLGSFPLAIAAMEHYRTTIKLIKFFRNLNREHTKVCNRLQELKLGYEHQLQMLLFPLLDDGVVDSQQYAQLLANPGGEGWKEACVEEALTDRLQDRYQLYLNVMAELEDAMTKLCKSAKVDDSAFQSLLEKGDVLTSSGTKKISKAEKLLMTKANISFQGKKFQYSLRSFSRDELLDEVYRCIKRLSKLLEGSAYLLDCTRNRRDFPNRRTHRSLLEFWKHGENIFKLLKFAWSCNCRGKAQLTLQHHRTVIDSMNMRLYLCHGEQATQVKVGQRESTHATHTLSLPGSGSSQNLVPISDRSRASSRHRITSQTNSSVTQE